MPGHPLRPRSSLMSPQLTAVGHRAIKERSERASRCLRLRHLQAGKFRKRFPGFHSFLPTEIPWDELALIQASLDFF